MNCLDVDLIREEIGLWFVRYVWMNLKQIVCFTNMVELGKPKKFKYMCGRFVLYSEKLIKSKFNLNIKKNFNISPNQEVVIINEKLKAIKVKWGIIPSWKKTLIINARFETINEKKTFRNFKKCVFVANGYYEWLRTEYSKTPYYHFNIDQELIFFAGIYNSIGCCIVTNKSVSYLSKIHGRQPFFLKENQIKEWISKENNNLFYDEIINFHPVSNAVNKIWNNSEDLIFEKDLNKQLD